MPKIDNEFLTMCYDNPDMKEFVFSCKGRPFAMMSSQKIPVPTISLIDYKLVEDLGIKLTELQCSRFTFAGFRLRILGKIHQTIQCVKNGKLLGNIHLKASVVEDLKANFDTHSIAGAKMTKLLSAPSPSSNNDKKLSSPTPPRTPSRASQPTPPPARLSSPPGFPSVPQYPAHQPEVIYTETVLSEPNSPVPKPPSGYTRRLQLRPRDSVYRDWFHGRVTNVIRPGLAQVDILRLEGDPYKRDQPVYDENCVHPGLDVSVNDVVLAHGYSRDPNLETWAEGRPRIYVVYNEQEVEQLQHHGVQIPDCPPEKIPGGYYG